MSIPWDIFSHNRLEEATVSRYGSRATLVGAELRITGVLGGVLWTLPLSGPEPSAHERYEMLDAAKQYDVPYARLLDAAAGMSTARYFD